MDKILIGKFIHMFLHLVFCICSISSLILIILVILRVLRSVMVE